MHYIFFHCLQVLVPSVFREGLMVDPMKYGYDLKSLILFHWVKRL